MKYFNSRLFWRMISIFAVMDLCILLTACTSVWITAVSGLLPAIAAVVQAVMAFVVALQGKTVSAAFTAAVQKWQQNVATEIADARGILVALKQNVSTSLISQFQVEMKAVLSEFNSLLTGVDITDSSTVAKLTEFVGLGIAAINAILALIPLALSKLQSGASQEELKHYDNLAANATKTAVATMKETYVAILAERTTNADVNAALDELPRSI